jgi:hypothetical protein
MRASICAGIGALLVVVLAIPASADVDGYFYSAVTSGDLKKARLLLDKGASVEARVYGNSALTGAAVKGQLAAVELLLEKGAAIDGRNNRGETALIAASKAGQTAVVKLLLDKGADKEARDQTGITALEAANSKGHFDIVSLLIPALPLFRPIVYSTEKRTFRWMDVVYVDTSKDGDFKELLTTAYKAFLLDSSIDGIRLTAVSKYGSWRAVIVAEIGVFKDVVKKANVEKMTQDEEAKFFRWIDRWSITAFDPRWQGHPKVTLNRKAVRSSEAKLPHN